MFDDFFRIDEVWVRCRSAQGELAEPRRSLSLERGDSVAALLHNIERDQLILVEQFKYPAHAEGGWIIETLAGMIDGDEAPEDAVRREALEETGYLLGKLHHLSSFYVSPGGSSERVHLFFAEVDDADRVQAGGGLHEEGEDIVVREYSPTQLSSALTAGEFKDAKTLIAVLWFLGRRELGSM